MATNINQTAAQLGGKQRFSDRLEFRRGWRDGQSGRAPASLGRQYKAGYAEGRRDSRRGQVSRASSADAGESGHRAGAR